MMAVAAIHASSMGLKRALSESDDSEYSEDEDHYPSATVVLSPALHSLLPEWNR